MEYKDFELVLLRQTCQRNHVLNYASGNGLDTKKYPTRFATCYNHFKLLINLKVSIKKVSIKKVSII